MHRLLKRQVKQTFGKEFDSSNFDVKTLALLENITETYRNFDEEKAFLNQTVRENKQELKEMYRSMIVSSRLAGIGEMMENITHQWKQPLSIILNIVALLKFDLKDNRELKIIEEQTRYLDKTIKDFQNFSSHSEEEKEFFCLEKSISETLKLFDFQSKVNKVLVHTNLEENLSQQGDIGKFNQALLVILSNAKDAFISKEMSNRVIEISTKSIDESVIITVQDNAGGIPEEIIDKIFEPYFTTKFKDKGTGIGLSMTYNIVKKMNGTIKAENYNNGALFTMSFPQYTQRKNENENE
ncbi:MAG: Histidine kinase [uncultured Sulfurovum sp.]|uniref:histidine kinase n=1 Tax=uncultured Sulfurovum sp. TaxID=269237 RepID=A0A6S6T8L1_9BACT|nr:MAG: Histidine kinase [uncultured Sulfurovum sp.]